jgi:hypothetical protein
VVEDAASTGDLFDGGGCPSGEARAGDPSRHTPVPVNGNGSTAGGNGHADANGNGHANGNGNVRPGDDQATPAGAATSAPLVRYEWRSPSGDTLVVEAGWPGPGPERPDDAAGRPVTPVDLRS